MRPLLVRALALVFSVSFGAGMSGAVWAGPTIDTAPPVAPSTSGTTSVLSSGVVRSGQRGEDAAAVEMLVDMQQPGAGLQFNERQRAAEARARAAMPTTGGSTGLPAVGAAGPSAAGLPALPSATGRAAEVPPVSAAGLFGAGVAPPVQAPRGAAAAQAAMPGHAAGDGGGSGAGAAQQRSVHASDSDSRLARWLALPGDLIAYVRENRGFVLGLVGGLLAAVWMGSLLVNRLRG